MFNTRQITVISVFTASLLYAWSRYHKKKKSGLEVASSSQASESKDNNNSISAGTAEQLPSTSQQTEQVPLSSSPECRGEAEKAKSIEAAPSTSSQSEVAERTILPDQVPSVSPLPIVSEETQSTDPPLPQEVVVSSESVEEEVVVADSSANVSVNPLVQEESPLERAVAVEHQTHLRLDPSAPVSEEPVFEEGKEVTESSYIEAEEPVTETGPVLSAPPVVVAGDSASTPTESNLVEIDEPIAEISSVAADNLLSAPPVFDSVTGAGYSVSEKEVTPIESIQVEPATGVDSAAVPLVYNSDAVASYSLSEGKDILASSNHIGDEDLVIEKKSVTPDNVPDENITLTESNLIDSEEPLAPPNFSIGQPIARKEPIMKNKKGRTLSEPRDTVSEQPAETAIHPMEVVVCTPKSAQFDNDIALPTLPSAVECGSDVSDQMPTPSSSGSDADIIEVSPEILDGKEIPRVLVSEDMWAEVMEPGIWRESFIVPATLGGVLIGRFGKNVRELKNNWNAEFSLNNCPGQQDVLLLRLSSPIENKDHVLNWVMSRVRMKPSQTTIGNPNQLRRFLPLGKLTHVQARSMFGAKELFVTVHDEEFDRYLEMQKELDRDYSTLNTSRMQLYEPVTSGTVAVLPHAFGYARALILKVVGTWPRQALCFLLDHGTFSVVALNDLRKIKAKYMHVPFQVIHVTWAHALPVYCDMPDLHCLRTFFSSGRSYAYPVRMETCCRSSVVFLERQPFTGSADEPVFHDILGAACHYGLYGMSPLHMIENRQKELNRTDTAYYVCPYSEVPYQDYVFCVNDPSFPSNGDQPPAEQLMPCQNGYSSNTRHRRGGANGTFRRSQNPTSNNNNYHNGRRFRGNGHRNANFHQNGRGGHNSIKG